MRGRWRGFTAPSSPVFFAALFGGTPSQITGPTGPMTVVMAAVIMRYAHDPALAFTVVVLGGFFQILFGAFRLGRFIKLMPFPVISGFMSGIGVIILILQLPPLLGHADPDGGPVGVLMALPGIVADINPAALGIGLMTVAIVFLMPKRLARLVPSPLVALVFGTLVVSFFLPGVPVLGDIPTGLPAFTMPVLNWDSFADVLSSALILALLGSIDSLLTSLIADNITRTQHLSDKELIGQGIGNMVAGLFGAIPGAGATMRTVVNIRSGGTTPLAGMLHALVLLAVMTGLGPLAGKIPHAVLAGILIKVGIDIVDWVFIRRVPDAPRPGVVLMFLVLGLTVFVDLITAVGVGMVAASLLFVKRMSDLQLQNVRSANGTFGEVPLTPEEDALLKKLGEQIMLYHLSGALSFGAAKGLARRITPGPGERALVLDLTDVMFVDTSASLGLEDVIRTARDRGLLVLVVGLRAPVIQTFQRLGIMDLIGADSLFDTRLKALARAAEVSVSDEQAPASGD